MADFEAGQRASWLETELARELCPIAAPESLWSRIHEQRRPLRVRPHPWTAWSIAVASLLILLAGLAWRAGAARDPRGDLETLAARELQDELNGSGKVDLQSSDTGTIQRWMKAKLDIDLRLADRPMPGNRAVQLLGARIIRLGRLSVGAIRYRVGQDYAAMLVTNRNAGLAGTVHHLTGITGQGHGSLRPSPGRTSPGGDVELYSWSLAGNDYAIAFGSAGEPEQSCLLCHAGPPALMVFR